MRTLSLLSLGLLAACDTGGLDQFGLDTDDFVFDDDTSVDGTEADTGDDDTDDTGTDPDTDSGISGNGGDCHLIDPLNVTGWSRSYTTNYGGITGPEVQTSNGLQTAPNGQPGYQIDSTITPTDGTPPIQITRFATCQNGAAFWLGDNVQATATFELIPGFELPAEIHTESYPLSNAQYLPTESAISSGQYTFTYTRLTKDLNAGAGGDQGIGALLGLLGGGSAPIPNCKSDPSLAENDATCVDVTTELTAIGQQNVTVGGTTYSAYYMVETTEESAAAGSGQPGGAGDIGGLLEALGFGNVFGDLFGLGGGEPSTIIRAIWYVEGIGIVKEQQYDITNGGGQSEQNLIVTRELVQYTGL